jgi:hypothetical protein
MWPRERASTTTMTWRWHTYFERTRSWPPMNADTRRYNAPVLSAFICVHLRLNAFPQVSRKLGYPVFAGVCKRAEKLHFCFLSAFIGVHRRLNNAFPYVPHKLARNFQINCAALPGYRQAWQGEEGLAILLNLRRNRPKISRKRIADFCKSNKIRQAYFCRRPAFENLAYFASPSEACPTTERSAFCRVNFSLPRRAHLARISAGVQDPREPRR